MALALGALLALAGVAIFFDLGGAAALVTRRVTSRSLGSLAPGYAATRTGLRVYAVLLVAIGAAVAGVGLLAAAPLAGLVLLAAAVLVFLGASGIVVAGEVRTYRNLSR